MSLKASWLCCLHEGQARAYTVKFAYLLGGTFTLETAPEICTTVFQSKESFRYYFLQSLRFLCTILETLQFAGSLAE
jgi:hypothetical protein